MKIHSNRLQINRYLVLCTFFILCVTTLSFSTGIETPAEHFGFQPGNDGMLFNYDPLIQYFQKLDAASPRLKMIKIGKSPFGEKMYAVLISSPENIQNLDRLKTINRRLALDSAIPAAEKTRMLTDGKVFILATLSMHSTEVGPSQAAPHIAWQLLTTKQPDILNHLENVVLMLVLCHNQDGMDMIVNHFKKYKGTKYEGCSMPGVYHKYVGHDNNRDFITLSQSDNRAVARIYNQTWFPQVMVEKHQMGSRSVRYFVPPMHDPIAENIPAEVWNWTWIFGSNMTKDMTEQGLAGVAQHYLFDDYWPGSTETCLWKNVIGLLTECAGVQLAKPIFIEPNELGAWGKGLAEYKKSINFSSPWPGGWWRLSDILQYEISSLMSMLKTASLHRDEILRFRNHVCQAEVQKGLTEAPFYFVLPQKQHDRSEFVNLINLLDEHGIAIFQLTEAVQFAGNHFKAGDIVIPLAQPFRPFIKEVLERQQFPVRHYTPGGKIIKPYDITSWSLPLHRGVAIHAVNQQLKLKIEKLALPFDLKKDLPEKIYAAIFPAQNNESFRAAFLAAEIGLKVERLDRPLTHKNIQIAEGSFVIHSKSNKRSQLNKLLTELKVAPVFLREEIDLATTPLKIPRIALVETFFHDMDAGWTRFVLDTYSIPHHVVRPGEFEKTDFAKNFDVVIFPDADKSVLMKGKWKSADNRYFISSYPPDYTKGIGKKGLGKLMTFLDQGGCVVAWGRSTHLFLEILTIARGKDEKEEFQLPVRDVSARLKKDGLYCPGSFMKVQLKPNHPLTLGLPAEIGVFYRGRPAFTTSIPIFDMDRRVIAKFPEKDILLSGYCEKEEKIGNKSAAIWAKKGKGQFVFFGFNPQFRASTQASFKLLFNALLLPKIQ